MLTAREPAAAAALACLEAGDGAGLEAHLAAHPRLLTEVIALEGPDPGAYFAEPRLLWFVAENPVRHGRLPANIADLAARIAARMRAAGAPGLQRDLDTALALAASGCVPRDCGVQRPLIAALVAAGADPAQAMRTALAHREQDAAEALLEAGAPLSLTAAAGLGRIADLHERTADASGPELQEALAIAAANGQAAAIAALLAAGAEPNRRCPEGCHAHSTPLQQAVSIGAGEAVRVLLKAGADPELRDTLFGGDAWGWAHHCGQPEMAALLPSRG